MTPQQAACIINARNAAIIGLPDEVNHWLYRTADFHCTNYEPWKEIEDIADQSIVIRADEMARIAEALKEIPARNKTVADAIAILERSLSSCASDEVEPTNKAMELLQSLLNKPR